MGEKERETPRESSTIFPKVIWFYMKPNMTSKTKIFNNKNGISNNNGISILTRFHKKLWVEIFLWCKTYSTYV